MRKFAVAISAAMIVFWSAPTFAVTHYVSKTGLRIYPYDTWATAADTVARAVEAASEWDTIMIASGHYVTDTIILKKGQVLRGSGEDSTVFDTLPLNPQRTILAADSCEVSYLTILGLGPLPLAGSTRWSTPTPAASTNSGIELGEDEGIIVRRVRFESLTSGIASLFSNLSNTDRTCRVDSCQFRTFTKAIVGYVSRFDISSSVFSWDQSANVGVIQADFSGVVVNNCVFHGYEPTTAEADAAAISTYRSDPIIVRNCLFYSTLMNPALELNFQDGSTDSVGVGLIENNTFVRFLQHLRIDRPGFVFRNNIMTWEMSGAATSPFYGGFALAEFNITWDNSPWDSGVVRIADTIPNDVAGNHDNRDLYPMFIDTIEFLLQAFSPAIDAGDPSILDADGSRSDIGYTGGPGGSAYSYPDLPPASPRGFRGIASATEIDLSWRRNFESDLAAYELFRDTMPISSADTNKVIAALPSDTTFADTNVTAGESYFYRVRAKDSQGNAGELSDELEFVASLVHDDSLVLPKSFVLHPNYPNPFNASTRFEIDVPIAGRVYVCVYDILGRRVETLHDGTLPVARHAFDWAPERAGSGVYFVVAKFGETTRVRKALLLK